MNKTKIIIAISLFWLLMPLNSCVAKSENSVQDRLSFDFSKNALWKISHPQAIMIDSTELVDNRYPYSFERSLKNLRKFDIDLNWNTVTLNQCLYLTEEGNKEITVNIRVRRNNLTDAIFIVNRYDEKMRLTAQDSIPLNVEGWHSYTATLSPKPTRYLDMTYIVTAIATGVEEGKEEEYKQSLVFDRMNILIDGKDINLLCSNPEDLTTPLAVDNQKIIPMELGSVDKYTPFGTNNTKILALGETVHYNDAVAKTVFEIIKSRIVNNRCRLVMVELDYNIGSLINYYVSGSDLHNDYRKVLKSKLKETLSESWFEFFDWLRAYNKDKERKVLLLGIDINKENTFPAEMEILSSCVQAEDDKENLRALIYHIASLDYKEALAIIKEKSAVLESIMSKEMYDLFLYYYELTAKDNWNPNEKRFNEDDKHFFQRDESMYYFANHYINSFLQEGETACIYAHFGHTAYIDIGNHIPVFPMGYYMQKTYGKEYSNYAIVVGEGECTIKGGSVHGISNIALTKPVKNSIEQAAKEQSNTAFCYTLNENNYSLNQIRNLGSVKFPIANIDSLNQFSRFIVPKGVMDGFVFVPIGTPMFDAITEELKKELQKNDIYIWDRRLEVRKNTKK